MTLNLIKKTSGDIMKRKHIPMRKCVGCHAVKPKKDLIRIVRTPEAAVEIDTTGKKSGRGAYICSSIECLQKAIQRKQLERALNIQIKPEIEVLLEQQLE